MTLDLLTNSKREIIKSVISLVLKSKVDTYSIFEDHQESIFFIEDAFLEVYFSESKTDLLLKSSFVVIKNNYIKIVEY